MTWKEFRDLIEETLKDFDLTEDVSIDYIQIRSDVINTVEISAKTDLGDLQIWNYYNKS